MQQEFHICLAHYKICSGEAEVSDAAPLDDLRRGLIADEAHADDEVVGRTCAGKLPLGVPRCFETCIGHVDMQDSVKVEDIMAFVAVEF